MASSSFDGAPTNTSGSTDSKSVSSPVQENAFLLSLASKFPIGRKVPKVRITEDGLAFVWNTNSEQTENFVTETEVNQFIQHELVEKKLTPRKKKYSGFIQISILHFDVVNLLHLRKCSFSQLSDSVAQNILKDKQSDYNNIHYFKEQSTARFLKAVQEQDIELAGKYIDYFIQETRFSYEMRDKAIKFLATIDETAVVEFTKHFITNPVVAEAKQEEAPAANIGEQHVPLPHQKLIAWYWLARKLKNLQPAQMVRLNNTGLPPEINPHFNDLYVLVNMLMEKPGKVNTPDPDPESAISHLKRLYLAFSSSQSPAIQKIINVLLQQVDEIQSYIACLDQQSFVAANAALFATEQQLQKKLTEKHGNSDPLAFKPVALLKTVTHVILEEQQRKAHAIATLSATIAPEEKFNQEAIRLHEAIRCLGYRLSLKTTPSDASVETKTTNVDEGVKPRLIESLAPFSDFESALKQDSKTPSETKTIVARYFTSHIERCVAGEPLVFPTLEQVHEDLTVLLAGKPPMSPELHAAVGILLSVLIGIGIAAAGASATAVAVVVPIAASIFSIMGFFAGYERANKHRETYEAKVFNLISPLENLVRPTAKSS